MTKLDRNFLFLRGPKLTVFAERILRHTEQNPYLPKPETEWTNLQSATRQLHAAMNDKFIKRRERAGIIRQFETALLITLGALADVVEHAQLVKSDIYTTGFRPQNEHQRLINEGIETRRRQRLSAKMASLNTP